MYTLNCKGKLLSLERPVVMGIVNATRDSFYKGHLSYSEEELISLIATMHDAGATIIDVGGQSTRPGSTLLSAEEEMERVMPIILLMRKQFPELIISVDTF